MVLQKRTAKEEIQMQISLLLMQQIAQLFLILLMGYAVVKTGLLKASDYDKNGETQEWEVCVIYKFVSEVLLSMPLAH